MGEIDGPLAVLVVKQMQRLIDVLGRVAAAFLMAMSVVVGEAAAVPPLQPGDSVTFTIPVASGGASIHEGVRVDVTNAPAWLVVEATSLLGPVNIFPSLGYRFRLDLTVGTNLDSSYPVLTMDVHVTIATTTARLRHFVWRITSADSLRTFSATCLEDSGEFCGHIQELDTTPPSTNVRYIWSHVETEDGATFVAPHTLVELEATDPELNDSATSGLAAIEFKVDEAAVPEGPLAPYTMAFALGEGVQRLRVSSRDNAGNSERVRTILLSVDGTPPVTNLATTGGPIFTDGEGHVYVSSLTRVAFDAQDSTANAPASGVAYSEFALDPSTVAISWIRFTSPFTLLEGLRWILARSWDRVDNPEVSRLFEVRVDTTPPESVLEIHGPNSHLAEPAILVSSQTRLGIAAADPLSKGVASGAGESKISMGGFSFAVVSGTFILPGPDGPKELRWFSRDNVLNEEAEKSTTVVLDATPPAINLGCPAAGSPAFCRVFDRSVGVRGSVSDLHLAAWRLEQAPGRSAAEGFVLVSSGTSDIDGILSALDGSVQGFATLRLSAEDAVANASVESLDVYIGDPVRVFTLGGKEAFEKPSAVAVDSSSRIYVADAGRDRFLVYAPDGSFTRFYGTDGRSEPAFKQPSGVTVDGTGNIWVADTGNNRIVKLASDGAVLALVGKSELKRGLRRFKPGKGPGEFKRPAAVALDAEGNAYVADSGNRRVQVLSPAGAFLRELRMPPVQQEDDEEEPGRPSGVAVDGTGRVYALDREGRQIVVFDSSGTVLKKLTVDLEEPWGVAASADGGCIAVSDRETGKVVRLDEEGKVLLGFAAGKKPLGLAFGRAGELFVADAGLRQVLGYGFPVADPVVAQGERAKHGGGFKAQALAAQPVGNVLATLGPAGGSLRREDKAGVEVYEGALDEALELGVYEPETAHAEEAAAQGLASAGPPVEFGPEGLVFDKPVTLALPYYGSPAGLAVHYWDPTHGAWEPLPTRFEGGVARAETSHFSLYQALAPAASQGGTVTAVPAAVADAAFVFRDLYAFPNPARGGARQTIRLQVGVADSASANVYDVSGEQVYAGSFGPPVVLDDGNGKGPQWTYDLAWDAGGVGSGVYIYVVTAKKGGQADIRKSGRLAVLK